METPTRKEPGDSRKTQPADPEQAAFTRSLSGYPRLEAWVGTGARFELTRFVVLRLLGFVYTAAFASLALQVLPLIGERGLMPAATFVERTVTRAGSSWAALFAAPSLFMLVPPSDALLLGLSLLGLALSMALLLGVTNSLVLLVTWALYRSFVTVGQLWYGYGWELLLVETGFLAVFLCPLRSLSPFPRTRAPLAVVWLLRWLAVRVMLGAGLIKLRGDPCWRDLTCLDFHFETQPLPNPLSALFDALPHWVLAGGVVYNHLAELLLPLFVFGPRTLRVWGALGMIGFQLLLILSGNLAFLNWLTIVPLVACLDDAAIARVLPPALRERARGERPVARPHALAVALLVPVVLLLSISPVANMLSPRQQMNAAFEPLMLVNSYGAFGGIGRIRRELVIEGTRDPEPTADARWEAYELPYKPGDPRRMPGVISPLQPRLDWQLWFAAMASAEDEPWMLHLVWKLLHAEPGVRRLFAHDPFGARPPRYVRVMRYRYRFAPLSEPATWRRELEGYWLPPLPADDVMREAMLQLGYLEE